MKRRDNCHHQRGLEVDPFFDRTIAYLSADIKGKFELLSHHVINVHESSDAASVIDVIMPFMMQQASLMLACF